MAKVQTDNEVYLGSTFFPIKGQVKPQLISRFPQKLITGDFDYNNESVLSHWIINDQRGGIGIEEMDELKHALQCWFSTCDISRKGHILLPPLPTAVTLPTVLTITDGGFEAWDDATTLTSWTKTGSLAQGAARTGSYSASLTNGSYISQNAVTWDNGTHRGITIVVSAYAKTSNGEGSLRLYDGVGTTTGTAVAADNAWHEIIVQRTLSASATICTVTCIDTSVTGSTSLFDDLVFPTIGSYITCWCEFNGDLYFANGGWLFKISNSTGSISIVAGFPWTITDLKSSVGDSMYILFGDSEYYYYMSTAEAFTRTNVANANLGIEMDSLTVAKVNTSGQLSTSTDPNSATPTWTNNGKVNLPANYINALLKGPEPDGDSIIYLATRKGLYAHDTANAKMLETNLKIPNHPNGGRGAVFYGDRIFMPAGLDIVTYRPRDISELEHNIGLSRNDGLPEECTSEIMNSAIGYNGLYFIADTAVKNDSEHLSGVYRYWDGVWYCYWNPINSAAWASPTSATDSGSVWTNEANAYDGDTGTRAQASVAANSWQPETDYLALNKTTTGFNKVRVWLTRESTDIDQVDIDVKNVSGSWVNAYTGSITFGAWVEVPNILVYNATASVRIRFHNAHASAAKIAYVNEVQFLALPNVTSNYRSIIEATAYAYRLWFDNNGTPYYIAQQRNLTCPLKVSSYTYAQQGIHLSPWFDAGSPVLGKIAKSIELNCDGMSSDEAVEVYYRLDHANLNLDTGWTHLGSITTDGISTFAFGSSLGVSFKAIQFRFDLRRSTTNTLTPDILGIDFSYIKQVENVWMWSFEIDCSVACHNKTPYELWEALSDTIGASTFQEFTFRDGRNSEDTHYVMVLPPLNGSTPTGKNYQASYNITVIEM